MTEKGNWGWDTYPLQIFQFSFLTTHAYILIIKKFDASIISCNLDWRTDRPHSLFMIFGGFVFVKSDFITRIYFNCRQYAMFTICILFSDLTTNHWSWVTKLRSIKQFPDPKNSTAFRLTTEIPGSVTAVELCKLPAMFVSFHLFAICDHVKIRRIDKHEKLAFVDL